MTADTPRYAQIFDMLSKRVQTGLYPIDMRLPTESELCDEFNASRFTIREALRRMLEQGMVQRRQGAGSVVVSTTPQARYVHTRAKRTTFACSEHYRFRPILLKKDFERGLRATLIQGERRTSNIDSKLHLLGFDCFKL